MTLGFAEGRSYSRSSIPGLLPQLLYFGPACGDLDTLGHSDRQLEAGEELKDFQTNHKPHGLPPLPGTGIGIPQSGILQAWSVPKVEDAHQIVEDLLELVRESC